MSNDLNISLKSSENRLRRGWILRILHHFQTAGGQFVNDRTILTGLIGNGHVVSLPALTADLRLLEERGYVALQKHDADGIEVYKAAITSSGIYLHEGIGSDPGIDFGGG